MQIAISRTAKGLYKIHGEAGAIELCRYTNIRPYVITIVREMIDELEELEEGE